jgi:hypothetical protein
VGFGAPTHPKEIAIQCRISSGIRAYIKILIYIITGTFSVYNILYKIFLSVNEWT